MRSISWPKPFKYFEHVRFFLVLVSVAISLVVGALFLFIYQRADYTQLQRVREQALTYEELLTYTKMWNYDYGGVYIEKKDGAESNAYLKAMGINPDVKAEGGRVFTIRNHAIMIKEISRRSERDLGASFRIVSLKPIAPDNKPDSFETEAFRAFEGGAREFYLMENGPMKPAEFRYAVPLRTEKSCLECHAAQGFGLNDILGAISITIPSDYIVRETNSDKKFILISAVTTIGFLLLITCFLTWRLVIKLDEAQRRLKKQAITDELTGLRNRRYVMERLEEEYERSRRLGESLCLITLDIDHFKMINDSYGHPFGDLVLQQVSSIMKETVRRYDELGRIGGEEFLVLAPATALEEAIVLAERLCQCVRHARIGDGDREITVTMSAGVAGFSPGEDSSTLLKRADKALYRAKQEGRDRVVAE